MDEQAACLADSQVQHYLEGKLPDSQRSAIEKHAARCARCRTLMVERFEFNRERVISSLTPDDVVQRVQSLCPSDPIPTTDPGEFESKPWPRRLALIVIVLLLVALTIAYFLGLISG